MADEQTQEITLLINAASSGDKAAASQLLPLVYDELRKLAQSRMSRMATGQTLQATALVHEAYMRVVGNADPGWDGRAHFFGAAALAMRNILVERARRKGRIKHGGGKQRVEFDETAIGFDDPGEEILALDEVLQRLEKMDTRKAHIVNLRYFAGLSIEEIADLLKVSTRTIEREWRFTRAWLHRELAGDGAAADTPPADDSTDA